MKSRCLPPLIALVWLSQTRHAGGQEPIFGEVQPVHDPAAGSWTRLPALNDMRSAWGDVDADGDLDLIIMGDGPVTKLYLNQRPAPAPGPVALVEAAVSASLPQLQDGALAWGDFDNDGDLDLAMTGSVTATPSGEADLRFCILTNIPDGAGGRSFTASHLPGPCYGGCLSWGDMDRDGDMDLFLSGLGGPQLWPLARLYENVRGNLRHAAGQHFWSFSATKDILDGVRDPLVSPEDVDVNEARRCTWVDVNRDGFPDLVLTGEDSLFNEILDGPIFVQEVWMNRATDGAGRFERLGDTPGAPAQQFVEVPPDWPVLAWPPAMEASAQSGRVAGGVGDWDGDGWSDLAFVGWSGILSAEGLPQRTGWVLQRDPDFTGPLDAIPGFTMLRVEGATAVVLHRTSADWLNRGREQWLGSVLDGAGNGPDLRLLADDGTQGLDDAAAVNLGSAHARVGGALEAVDADGDGRLDLLHSGYDSSHQLDCVCYRNQMVAANTAPVEPAGLVAEVSSAVVHFRWDPAVDSQTPQPALRYALRLRHESGRQYVLAGARADGKRLLPGLDGTLQRREFEFVPGDNTGDGRLPAGVYSWSVQTVDSGGLGSVFAPERSFTIAAETATEQIGTGLPVRDTALDVGDFDGAEPGELDAAIAGTPLTGPAGTLLPPNHSNRFIARHELPSILKGAVRWGDVDGDGDLDLALTGDNAGTPITRVYRNAAGGFHLRGDESLTGVAQSALDWGDVDNDGDLDLIVTGYAGGVPTTRLYRNVAGRLVEQATNLPGYGSGAVAWGDYDADGDLDLLLCGDTSDYSQPLLPVAPPPFHLRPPGVSYLAGNPAAAPATPRTQLYRNDGLATHGFQAGAWQFTEANAVLPSAMSSFTISGGLAVTARAEWCDLSGDGKPELVLGGVFGMAGQPGYGGLSVKYFVNGGHDPNDLGSHRFDAGRELLAGPISRALQTLTCADWDCDGQPDILVSGRLNSAGSVETHIIRNEGMAFTRRHYLRSRAPDGDRFPAGLAAFGHFNGDHRPDVLLSGQWGLRTGNAPPPRYGVPARSSSLIDQLDYSDTFTSDSALGTVGRPLYPARPPLSAFQIENTHGHPPVGLWHEIEHTDSSKPFRFVNDNGGASLFSTDGGLEPDTQSPYPGIIFAPDVPAGSPPGTGTEVIRDASGAGSLSGFLELSGWNMDCGIPFAIPGRSEFVVQADAVQMDDHVRITTASRKPLPFFGADPVTGLSVLFKGDGSGAVSLRRGEFEAAIPGINSGISGPWRWYNYAVRFNRTANIIEIFVNQISRGTVNLNTFEAGFFRDFATDFVGIGGETPDQGGVWDGQPEGRLWVDNLQIGRYSLTPVPPPVRTWDLVSTLFFGPSEGPGTPPEVWTNAPPSLPSGLTASVQGTAITFAWQAATDDDTPPAGLTYNLHVERVDGQPGGMPGMADTATGRRLVCRTGNVGHRTTWTLLDLPAGTYRWGVQAIDAGLASSAFSHAAQPFTVGPPRLEIIRRLPPLHQWNVVHPAITPANLASIAAGRSARIVTGQRGRLFLSRRGGLFREVESGVFTDLHDALIDADGAMVVGDAGVIRTSSDGVVWTESPSGTSAPLRAVVRGGTGWVAGGDDVVLHSIDRRAWTPGTLPSGGRIFDVCWAMGRYVAVGERNSNGALFTSTDGLTWTDTTPPGQTRGRVTAVASDDQKFLAVGSDSGFFPLHNDIFSSPNGTSWTVTQTADAQPFTAIIHTPDGWLAVAAYANELRRSTDGLTWQTVYRDSFGSLTAIAADAGVVTIAGLDGIIFDSPAATVALTTWTQRAGASPVDAAYYSFRGLAAEGETIAAIGSAGLNFLSRDGGRTWQRGTNGSFDGFYGIARGAGRFVRTFKEGIESSTDGETWERATVTDTRALVFGNGGFVVARTTGGFMVSTDGRTWSASSPAIPWCPSLTFGNGRFLARESSGAVHASTDGLTWIAAAPVSGSGLFCFARDRFFAMRAATLFDPLILHTSADGVTWQPVPGFPANLLPAQIVWHRDRFLALGEQTFSSTNLSTWLSLPVPTRSIAAVSTSAGLIVAGSGQSLLLAPDTAPSAPAAPVTMITNGPFDTNVLTFTITGPAGQEMTLERSPDLNQWTAVQTFTLTDGSESLELEIPQPGPQEYFRLLWTP